MQNTITLNPELVQESTSIDALFNSAKELMRSELEKEINFILKEELTIFLDYKAYERTDSRNARNGYYSRFYETPFGSIQLNIPRDRLGEFFTGLFPKYQRHDVSIEDTVLDLFSKGLSHQDISDFVEKTYGLRFSKQAISEMTKVIDESVTRFRSRQLQDTYQVIYLDGTFLPVKRTSVEGEMILIAMGIDMQGHKEILGYLVVPNEGATAWRDLLEDLKSRGVKNVGLFCTDGLSGMPQAIREAFGNTNIQRCLLHLSRNIAQKVRIKDRKAITEDFKKVYSCENEADARDEFIRFLDKWESHYGRLCKTLRETENIFTFYQYPKEIRSSIYTNNVIEGYNKQLKRCSKKKEQFPNESSLDRFLVTQFEIFNAKNQNRVHKGFGQITPDDMFPLSKV